MGERRKRGGVYWIGYYRDGRRFEESARTEKFEKARDMLKVREGDIDEGHAGVRADGRFRFEDAAKDIEDGIRRQRPVVDWGTEKRRNQAAPGAALRRETDGDDHHGDVRTFTRRTAWRRAPRRGDQRRARHPEADVHLAVKGEES